MTNSLNTAALFLINTLFDLYLVVLMARMILAWVHADYYNPITQVIIKLTQPVISPLRRALPNFKGIELSTLIVILSLEVIKFFLIGLVTFGLPSNFFGLFILAGADTIKLLLNTFFYAIVLLAILSWVQQGYSPVARVLMQMASPIMRPFQRLIPPIGGFDLSPIPAMIFLQLLIILLVVPLLNLGTALTFG